MRGQDKVYQLPIPEEDKIGRKHSEASSSSQSSSRLNSLPQSLAAAGFLDTFLTPGTVCIRQPL